MKKLIPFLALSLLVLLTGACEKENNEENDNGGTIPESVIPGSVWYTHLEEDDVEKGHQDIVWKLEFSSTDNGATITGTANETLFNKGDGTYTVENEKSVKLNLCCMQPAAQRELDFKTFSAMADGRWRLDYVIRYEYGTNQDHVLIFVKDRIPTPEEVMSL